MEFGIMATYTEEIATEFNFPNITIWKVLRDGVVAGYKARTNDGFVMYDPNANDTELDPETMEERPVTYYYVIKSLNANYNFANFPWVAVPRDSVDENYIFGGGGNNDHEVM